MISYPRILAIANTLAFLLNALETGGVGPFSSSFSPSQDNASISAKYQTIITPNGIAFSIWGLIFLMQAIFVCYMWLSENGRTHPLTVEGVAWWYVGVCLAQTAWSPAFAYEKIGLSAFFMGCIFMTLLAIVIRQYIVVKRLIQTQTESEDGESSELLKRSDFWLLRFPFEIHFGWIAAAFALNLNIVVVASGADANTQFIVAVVFLVILVMLSMACLFLVSRPIYTVPWVVAWASGWISYELKNPQQSIQQTFSEEQIDRIRLGSVVLCGLIAGITFLYWIDNLFRSMRRKARSLEPGENSPLNRKLS